MRPRTQLEPTKVISIRVPDHLATRLEYDREVLGIDPAERIRALIESYIYRYAEMQTGRGYMRHLGTRIFFCTAIDRDNAELGLALTKLCPPHDTGDE